MQQNEINPVTRLILFSLSGAVLLIIPQFSDPVNLPKLLLLIGFTFASSILFLTLRRTVSHILESNISKVGFWLYLSLLVGIIFSGFLESKNVIRVLFGTNGRNNGLLYYVCIIILSLLILKMKISIRDLIHLSNTLSWLSIIVTSYCLIQFFNLDPIPWANQYNRILGTVGNPNFSATLLALFSIFWAHKFVNSFLRGSITLNFQNVTSLGMSCLAGFLSYSTESLQGPVILCAGLFLLLFIILNAKLAKKWVIISFLFVVPIAIGSAFLSFLGYGPLGNSLEQYTLKLRSWYAYFGWKSMLDNPLTGVGVDNYIYSFRKYRTQEFINQYGNSLSSNNAHSIPMQIGATFGMPVFILFCILQFLVLYKSLKILMSNRTNLEELKTISLLWILSFSQTLLSIENIGLGVLHWLMGAIILNVDIGREKTEIVQVNLKKIKKHDESKFPEWVGALTITSLVIGLIPSFALYREDQAFKVVSQITVASSEEKEIVREYFSKLKSVTLLDPAKVNKILPNLYTSGLLREVEDTVKQLYAVEPNDAYVLDALATYYQNSKEYRSEIETREKLRELSPLDFRLEGILARAYFDAEETWKLKESVERLKNIARDSQEFKISAALLAELEMKQSP